MENNEKILQEENTKGKRHIPREEKFTSIIIAIVGIVIIVLNVMADKLNIAEWNFSGIREALDRPLQERFGRPDAPFSFGISLILMSVLRLLNIKRNVKQRREQEILEKDERMAMIRGKASHVTLFVMMFPFFILAFVLIFLGYWFAGFMVFGLLIAELIVWFVLFYWHGKRM